MIDHETSIPRFKRYPLISQRNQQVSHITSIYEDKQNRLWIGSAFGVGVLNRETGKYIIDNKNKDLLVRSILQDQDGIVWVGTSQGLYWFDELAKTFIRFKDETSFIQNTYETGVMSLYEDRSGAFWVGTLGKGIYLIDRKSRKFSLYQPTLKNKQGQTISITSWHILQGDSANLWIRTIDNHLVKYNYHTEQVKLLKHDPQNLQSLSNDKVNVLYKDSKGRIWVGTYDGLNLLDQEKGFVKRYYPAQNKNNIITKVFEDSERNLLVCINAQWIYKLNAITDTFEKHLQLPKIKNKHPLLNTISVHADSKFWMGARDGLLVFNPNNQQYQMYNNTTGLKSNSVLDIYQAKSGQIWLTTYGGGLSKVIIKQDSTLSFIHYGKLEGLMNEFVYGILEDTQGNLWMSQEKGISKFNPITKKFTNYTIKDGIQDGEFNQDSFAKGKNGALFFGGSEGINAFYPEKITNNNFVPPIILTDFQIFNKSVSNQQANSLFQGTINYTKKITLTYEQAKAFSFEFVALNYINSISNRYKVKLVGYDKNWRNLGFRNFVSYTNIPPNTYTLKVLGANNDGIWNTQGLNIIIVILPAWWQTWWFKIGWISTTVLLLVVFYRVRVASIKRQKRILEQKVVDRTREVVVQKKAITERNKEIITQNEELRQQQDEIMAQRDAIELQNNTLSIQNKRINQSIRSAKTIQEAILPFEVRMKKTLGEYFVIYQPRDIVSGDFYWLGEVQNKRIVAVIDCTGHGVPGAFMSMVGFTMLNEIINTKQVSDPSDILEQLRQDIRYYLRQDETGGRNGMDVVLVTLENLDSEQVRVSFAGAKRPLWYIQQNSTATEFIKGSSVSIGIIYEEQRSIQTHTFICPRKTLLYLGTDGFTDQNNIHRKKIGNQKLMKMLYLYRNLPLSQQKQALEKMLHEHIEGTEQRDDILFLGFKL